MPPTKRKAKARIGRPPLPESFKSNRKKRSLGYVDNETWELIKSAAATKGWTVQHFIKYAAVESAKKASKA